MTTAKEQFKSDLQKDPEDLAREVDGIREDLEGTVDELMQQFSPSELLNRGISLFQSKGNYDFIRNLSSQVENNPIPTVLAGVSLVWLMSASKQPPVHRGESFTDKIGKKAGATRETGHRMTAGASDAMHRVGDASRHTAESARSGLRNAREGYSQMLSEQPLLVGVLAVAAGTALGALLPRTSAEDRMMGEMSDQGVDTLKEKTEEKLKDAQGKAAPESAERDDASAASGPTSPAAKPKSSPGSSAGEDTPAGSGTTHSNPVPPQLDPASPGAAQDSSKTYPGTNY